MFVANDTYQSLRLSTLNTYVNSVHSFSFVKCYFDVSCPMLHDSQIFLIKQHAKVQYKNCNLIIQLLKEFDAENSIQKLI